MEEESMNTGQPFVVTCGTSELGRSLEDYPDGIIIPIDKPYRWTSADVIRKIKYAAVRHFGKKNLKIGHAGTLDPLATGILIVCIGRATKLAQKLMDHDKEYVAGITFGATTPSYDLEKEIDREWPHEHITEALLREKLAEFVGEQEQVAPLFSAKSIDGVRAYEHARRLYKRQKAEADGRGLCGQDAVQGEGRLSGNGNAFDKAADELLRTARINIYEAELLGFWPAGEFCEDDGNDESHDFGPAEGLGQLGQASGEQSGGEASVEQSREEPRGEQSGEEPSGASRRIHVVRPSLRLPHADIRLACGKGTYVRAFARDLGEALGSGAHLSSLRRTASGPFTLSSAVPLPHALSLLSGTPPCTKKQARD